MKDLLEVKYLYPTQMPDEFRDALCWILHVLRRADFNDFARAHAGAHFFDALETVRCHLVGMPTEVPAPTVRGEGWSL
ncbi:MAG: hypothetical protein DCC65_07910 [Planctomycetota bacterium]|nr:MAG: hypothetical protein DCC65_07910 [Planctomycetota bacterium]